MGIETRTLLFATALLAATAAPLRAQDAVAPKGYAVLQKYCAQCHHGGWTLRHPAVLAHRDVGGR